MSDSGLPDGFGPDDPTAGDRAETEHARVGFTFKEHPPRGETFWVSVEPDVPGLSVLKRGDAFLGLEFREGISFEQARAFAHEMERMFSHISYTKFIT